MYKNIKSGLKGKEEDLAGDFANFKDNKFAIKLKMAVIHW
jgi:hypothetical protein